MKGWFTMRKPRVDLLYTNLALEAAYARDDAVNEILAITRQLKLMADGHDAKTKGGKIDPDAMRASIAVIEQLLERINA
jgi:hypothetical protein